MPEFLSEIPPDFADKWIAMPFPQGNTTTITCQQS